MSGRCFPAKATASSRLLHFSLTPQGAKTEFLVNVYTEALVPRMSTQALQALEKQMAGDYERLEAHILPILKRLSEAR